MSTAVEQAIETNNRRLVLAGQLAFFPTGIITTILGPMLPILISRWGLNDTQAGNLFLIQFFAALVGVQLSGVLLARLGFRPAFLLGLIAMGVGVASLYTGSRWAGMASVAVFGLGQGLIIPTDNLMIAELRPNARAAAVSLLNFYWGVGAVFCSLSIAWAYAHHLLPTLLGGIAAFLVLLAVLVRNMPFPGKVQAAQSSIAWGEVLKSPIFWLFSCVFFLYPGAETAVGGWIGSYVNRMSSTGAAMAPMMPAFFWLALTVGRAAAGSVLKRVSERQMLIGGYGFATIGIGLMLWHPTLAGIVGSALITGLAYAALYPITVAKLSQRFGVSARSIGPVMFSLAAIGPAVVPWTVGVISNATGNLRAGLMVPFVATLVLLVLHARDW